METQKTHIPVLELLPQPAFSVSDGKIAQINQAASIYSLEAGAQILPMLASGREEYASLHDGSLYLSLCINAHAVGATVIAQGEQRLFILEPSADHSELRALSLAAQELRSPLSAMLATSGRILQNASSEQSAMFTRRVYQILRMLSNMSDAFYYCDPTEGHPECVQMCSFLEEILSKSREQLLCADITLEYTLPNTAVYTTVDRERVERAVYNMLSNAAKRTAPGGTIRFAMTTRQKKLRLSVTNRDRETGKPEASNVYTRYLRTPGITDHFEGIGLGMVLIRAAAMRHNGVVLIDHPDEAHTRVTMTVEIRLEKASKLRTPVFVPDYAGELDHGLQEFSEILPADLYTGSNAF